MSKIVPLCATLAKQARIEILAQHNGLAVLEVTTSQRVFDFLVPSHEAAALLQCLPKCTDPVGEILAFLKVNHAVEINYDAEVVQRRHQEVCEDIHSDELNFVIEFSSEGGDYDIFLDDTNELLGSQPTLQSAWEEVKDECERRGTRLGDVDLRKFDPSEWDDVVH